MEFNSFRLARVYICTKTLTHTHTHAYTFFHFPSRPAVATAYKTSVERLISIELSATKRPLKNVYIYILYYI